MLKTIVAASSWSKSPDEKVRCIWSCPTVSVSSTMSSNHLALQRSQREIPQCPISWNFPSQLSGVELVLLKKACRSSKSSSICWLQAICNCKRCWKAIALSKRLQHHYVYGTAITPSMAPGVLITRTIFQIEIVVFAEKLQLASNPPDTKSKMSYHQNKREWRVWHIQSSRWQLSSSGQEKLRLSFPQSDISFAKTFKLADLFLRP